MAALNDLDVLRAEIERLNRELDQASSENIQSAKYGLGLLEEKQSLQSKCEELEALYENARHELEITQEALQKFQKTQQVTTKSGIEQEDALLNESAAMETSLNLQILELENETKQLRHELERVTNERDRMLQENSEIGRDKSGAEAERARLKAELKDMKYRETRMLSDYSELEEENISLQKQVSSLRSSQVEFEGAKHEIRRLAEEIELLNSQVEELASLKKIAEKQMEDALTALQIEREQKYALKKELDTHINRESLYNLSNMAITAIRKGIDESTLNSSDCEDEQPALKDSTLKRLETLEAETADLKSPDGTKVDLFSEIHLNELKKLEKQLESIDNEKLSLTANLREAQQNLDKSQNEMQNFMAKIMLLAAHVDALANLKKQIASEDKFANVSNNKDKVMNDKLNEAILQYSNWFTLSSKEIDTLKADLVELQKGLNCSDAMAVLRNEITNLKNKLLSSEQKSLDLHSDVHVLTTLSQTAGQSLNSTRSNLVSLSDDLAQLYHLVCTVNGETPNRVLLDHKNDDLSFDNDSLSAIQSQLKSDILTSKPHVFEDLQALSDAVEIKKYVDTISDQIKYLKSAVEHTIELNKDKVSDVAAGDKDAKEEIADLHEQIIKLKSLLSTKREQIATLRTVLKSNKNTAEVALTNLKSKYENEKLVVSDTMSKLRNELRILKEDAATFSSLRAMFAARCEEYVTQVDELTHQLSAAEEEKKTLNQLLRLAVQQKLGLTQKLEDLEMDREMRHVRRPAMPARGGGKSAFSRGVPARSSNQNPNNSSNNPNQAFF
ncbi:protein bicaudal D [Aedes aegypti]|uniref:Microtubule-associated protein bicaudal-d n=1 Tax=Aedes aegypti TaxID=7159 RepID=A0A1S4F960_AEDAE|nr:protein bicaudal D [Aedes aegypti]XP_021700590.1 protein bicaudal D [Aedes aegypti]XP_021700591.1 protein bicaudal D [Aedes aegypti]XP_021700592.1 protein bicaudal D [Aedes aegypti]XP_021700593.1 protein bicaudal D [Aedes aegypti]XP_021700594.1 protein bicaudal D [Aedes aegypti]